MFLIRNLSTTIVWYEGQLTEYVDADFYRRKFHWMVHKWQLLIDRIIIDCLIEIVLLIDWQVRGSPQPAGLIVCDSITD